MSNTNDTLKTESIVVMEDMVRQAIRFPATRLQMVRDTEDFGRHVVYGLSAWFNRLAENRSMRTRTPATWKDWVKRGLTDRWPWLSRWLAVRYVTREHEAWLIFKDLQVPRNYGMISIYMDLDEVDEVDGEGGVGCTGLR